jgi:nucleoside-diphosphate-sugar epimerase
LVTGASGYVATHCVQQLLEQGYSVRGTVRSLKNEAKVKPLRDLKNAQGLLELVEADLLDGPEKWVRLEFLFFCFIRF